MRTVPLLRAPTILLASKLILPVVSASIPPTPKDAWIKHEVAEDAKSSLSFYYSEDLSPLPVRAVTKPGDNKADPNLETGTYGLFTTCGRRARSAIVSHERPYLFFCTRRSGERVLTGYYRIGWYAKHRKIKRDFALAAGDVHFVKKPIPLAEVNQRLGTNFSEAFRQVRLVKPEDAECLRDMLCKQPDATEKYIAEIRRLERFNASRSGYRYVAHKRGHPFTWSDANLVLNTGSQVGSGEAPSTESPTGLWRCEECGETHSSGRLLRQCPNCGTANSIVPVPEVS